MALSVEVDVTGEVRDALRRAKEAGLNLTVPFSLIAKSWFRANRSIFALKSPGKYPDYGGFSPNTIVYGKVTRRDLAKERKKKRFGFLYPMMRATGRLEDSLTNPTHPESVNLIVNKNTLYLGTKVPYAYYHQASGSRSILPFRPIVFIGAEQIAPTEMRNESTRWVNIIDSYLQQALNRAGK